MLRFRWMLLVGLLAATVGCAGKADISGSVSYQGKPIRLGSVQSVGPDGMSVSGPISTDGTYTITGVRSGHVRFAIFSPDPDPPPPPESKGRPRRTPKIPRELPIDRSQWFELPKEASNLDASGLTAELRPGPNTVNLDLP